MLEVIQNEIQDINLSLFWLPFQLAILLECIKLLYQHRKKLRGYATRICNKVRSKHN